MDDPGIIGRFGRLAQSMYWTWPTAMFFSAVLVMLLIMTVWELAQPTTERRGFLPMRTTRGDRLFIGLLGAAWIHLGWLMGTEQALWVGSIVAVIWFLVVMRFG
jgi:predicted small integral membrane protein